jgi:hypothetical protein
MELSHSGEGVMKRMSRYLFLLISRRTGIQPIGAVDNLDELK